MRAGIAAAIVAIALAALRALDRSAVARDPAPRAASSGDAAPIPPDGLRAFAEHWDATDAARAEELHRPRVIEPPGVEARRRVAPLAGESGHTTPMHHAAPVPDDARMRFAPHARDIAPTASR